LIKDEGDGSSELRRTRDKVNELDPLITELRTKPELGTLSDPSIIGDFPTETEPLPMQDSEKRPEFPRPVETPISVAPLIGSEEIKVPEG
jgi:hypothetical protein